MALSFSYSPSALEAGIECANKANVSDAIASFVSKICSDSIPQDFAGIETLTSALTSISNTNSNVSLLPNKLTNIKNILDVVEQDNLDSSTMNTLINSNMRLVKASDIGLATDSNVNGGYIFVPDGYTDAQLQSMNLPMTVYIGGNGHYTGDNIFQGTYLPQALKSGNVAMESIVYIPSMSDCFTATGLIQSNVESLASYYNADTNRISAAGVSDGGRAVLKLASENPNYYSVVATAGADKSWGGVGDLTKSTETKFIFAAGDEDGDYVMGYQDPGAYNNIEEITEEINNAGGQAIAYQIKGGVSHDEGCRDFFNTELLNDMMNSSKSERADSSILGTYQVEASEYKASSVVLNGQNNAATPTFYKKITDGTVDPKQYIANQMGQTAASDTEIKLTIVDNSGNPVTTTETQTEQPSTGGSSGGGWDYYPVTTEPVTTEPVTTEPVTTEPVTTVVTPTPTTTETPTTTSTNNVVNNYYYNTGTSTQTSVETGSEVVTPEVVEPVITEPVVEQVVEPVTTTVESEHVSVTPVYQTNTTSSTNIWPTVGVIAGVAAAAAGAKVLYDKYEEKKEEDYNNEPVAEPGSVPYGYGSNYKLEDVDFKKYNNQVSNDEQQESYYDDTSFDN